MGAPPGLGWVVPPGRFRYVGTRAWWMARFGRGRRRYAYLAENVLQQWIPGDPAADWLLDRRLTGRRTWLQGDAERAVADGFEVVDRWPTGRWRAAGGNFFGDDPGEGSWQLPTPEFLATLPRDPQRLLARLRADSPGERAGYHGPLTYAVDLLRTGLVPPDLREGLYGALRAAGATDGVVDLNGRRGRARARDDGRARTEGRVDPADGEFLGERQILTRVDADLGLPSGTVVLNTTVRTAQVGALGAEPT